MSRIQRSLRLAWIPRGDGAVACLASCLRILRYPIRRVLDCNVRYDLHLMRAERKAEYRELAAQAQTFLNSAPERPSGEGDPGRINIEKQLESPRWSASRRPPSE